MSLTGSTRMKFDSDSSFENLLKNFDEFFSDLTSKSQKSTASLCYYYWFLVVSMVKFRFWHLFWDLFSKLHHKRHRPLSCWNLSNKCQNKKKIWWIWNLQTPNTHGHLETKNFGLFCQWPLRARNSVSKTHKIWTFRPKSCFYSKVMFF